MSTAETSGAKASGSVLPRSHRWRELDSVRFFAVFGVMMVHFSPNWLGGYGELGTWGVTFFFVLSGFLITQLLLSARQRLDEGQSTLGAEARHFFVRRCLRLWPIYFITLIVTAALGIQYGRSMFWWNATFVSNYYVMRMENWPGLFSHLWTLAIEQQFYTIWPWLILILPKRWLPGLFGGLIIGGALYRLAAARLGVATPFGVNISLPGCADFFSWGAGLAWVRRAGAKGSRAQDRWALAIAVLGAAILMAAYLGHVQVDRPHVRSAWTGTLCAVSAAALIWHCLGEEISPVRRVLRWPPLIYLGSISYGIYLLHNFSHWVAPHLLRHIIGKNYFDHETPHVLYLISLSLLFAVLSWHLIEQPFNRLRTRF